ncbi:MAG: hypothetical protein D6681_21475 [Calditrichaeota bacterium]|nr:MAG: hypothetical protein D6681_21475 [Calditrichota bacterium]
MVNFTSLWVFFTVPALAAMPSNSKTIRAPIHRLTGEKEEARRFRSINCSSMMRFSLFGVCWDFTSVPLRQLKKGGKELQAKQ